MEVPELIDPAMLASALLKNIYFAIDNEYIEDASPEQYDETGERIIILGLKSLLAKLNIEQMDVPTSDEILKVLLLYAFPDKPLAARALMDRWIASNFNEEKLPLFTWMIINNTYELDVLRFLKPIMNELTYYEHLIFLIDFDADPIVIAACATLEKMYGKMSLDTYKNLYERAVEQENPRMAEYFIEKLEQLSSPVERPKYLLASAIEKSPEGSSERTSPEGTPEGSPERTRNDEIELPPETHIIVTELPDVEAAFQILTAGTEEYGLVLDSTPKEREEVLQKFNVWWALADPVEKQSLIQDALDRNNQLEKYSKESATIISAVSESGPESERTLELLSPEAIEVFRILGPVLPIAGITLDPDSDYICQHYGGCRMFTCNCITTYDDETDLPDEAADWFTGNCIQCQRKIPNRIWSVRLPSIGGGWKYVFCSFDCLWTHAVEMQEVPVVLEMIKLLRQKVEKYGVFERTFDSSEELVHTPGLEQ